jgi:hypothetical protein
MNEKKKQYDKQYRLNNKEKMKQYRLDNKEKKKQYCLDNKEKIKQYRLDNKEKIKQYRLDNKEKMKQYYLDNKEKLKQYDKQYRLDNKEKRKQYRLDNKEKLNQYTKQYYLDNREKFKQYRLDNSERRRKYQNERKKRDPNFKLMSVIRTRILNVLKGRYKSKSTLELLGGSVEEVWNHIESKFQPGMTKENHGLWHFDHHRPCASFDLTDLEQQAKCFHYTNLKPMWAIDNLKKGAKYEMETADI